jgi:hypothetical protein
MWPLEWFNHFQLIIPKLWQELIGSINKLKKKALAKQKSKIDYLNSME